MDRAASFLVLPATDGFDAVRRQVRPSLVVSHGHVVAQTPPAQTTLSWPGLPERDIDFSLPQRRHRGDALWALACPSWNHLTEDRWHQAYGNGILDQSRRPVRQRAHRDVFALNDPA